MLVADDAHGHVARCQRRAGRRVGELGDGHDVARDCTRARKLFLAAHVEQAVQTLLCGGRAGDQPVVGRDGAGDDLAQRHLADELVGQGLEHVRQRLSGGVSGHLDLLGAGHDGHRPVRRGRTDLADEVGQPIDADTRERGSDEHRELEAVEHLVGERALQLGRRGHVARQVALELIVVARDDLLDQLVVDPMLFVDDVGRQGSGVVLPIAVVLERLIRQHVGDAVQRLLLAERQFERNESVAPLRLQRGEHVVEVGAWLVVFVDEDQSRDVAVDATLPRQFGADLDAVDGADHEDGEVGDAECRHSSPTKSA